MAKKTQDPLLQNKNTQDKKPIIPPRYQHPLAIGIIYLSILIFFHAIVFEGKTYQAADTIAPWTTFHAEAQAQGYLPLWNPYIFCGMPGFASLTYGMPQVSDMTVLIWERAVCPALSFLFFEEGRSGANLLFYLVFGIGMYLLAYHFFKNKAVAVLAALMAVFSTYIVLMIAIGHITKLVVLSWFPYVFLIVDKLRTKFSLLLALSLPLVVRLMLQAGQMQVVFYVFFTMGIYFLFFLIRALIKKENWKPILMSGCTLALAAGLAFLMGSTTNFSTLDYYKYSTRGSNPIQTAESASSTKTLPGGLDYDYATSWSFSPGELMTFFVPSWYGFGPMPYEGPLTQNQKVTLNLYWGPQPFIDGPQYMGLVVIVLALIGFARNRKEPMVQFMGLMILIALLISFGREFSLLYDLMYKYFPMFNKFRVPSMILLVVQFFTPLLAGYGILSFLRERTKTMNAASLKRWKYVFIGLAGGLALTIIGKDMLKGMYASFFPLQEVAKTLSHNYGQLNNEVVGMMFDFVYASVVSDIIIGFVLLLIVFGAFYMYRKGTIKAPVVYTILLLAVVSDLWRIDSKTSEPKDRQEADQVYTAPAYIKTLQQDSTQFRVLKIANGQPVYDNLLAYWRISNAFGYHAAKMRIYQDVVDVAGMSNPLVWQLMNVKYIISNQAIEHPMLQEVFSDHDAKVYSFRYWLPHVFFVNSYEVSDGLNTLNQIKALSFDPRIRAYVLEPPKTAPEPATEGASAVLTKYGTQEMEIRATATGNNLLFISDAYYPQGWEAFVDGTETQILRVDYLFRGVVVPKGTHTIQLKFQPASFTLGQIVSKSVSGIIWAGILLILGIQYWKTRKRPV